jgi:polar amino acid transport system permease protein
VQHVLPTAQLVSYDDAPSAFMALIQNKVDGFVLSESLMRRFIEKLGAHANEISVLSPPVGGEEWGLGVKKGEPRLLDAINTALDNMEKSGESQAIFDKWLGDKSDLKMTGRSRPKSSGIDALERRPGHSRQETCMNFNAIFAGQYREEIVLGARATLVLTLDSWLLAFGLGVVLAVLRASGNRIAEKLVGVFVAYHQNVPMLVQIILWYFGVPTLLPGSAQSWINAHNGEMFFATIAIGLCMSAYVSEDLRSGLRSVPWGQHEASRSLGLNYFQSMRYVILPQAVRVAMPPFINHTVLLFKNTSLAMVIGAAEMTYTVREVENQTFHTFEAYAVATGFYLAISLVLMALGAAVSHRTRIRST